MRKLILAMMLTAAAPALAQQVPAPQQAPPPEGFYKGNKDAYDLLLRPDTRVGGQLVLFCGRRLATDTDADGDGESIEDFIRSLAGKQGIKVIEAGKTASGEPETPEQCRQRMKPALAAEEALAPPPNRPRIYPPIPGDPEVETPPPQLYR